MSAKVLIILSLSLINSNSSSSGLMERNCGEGETPPPFDDILQLTQYYCAANFPTDQFNVSCLLASCPSLCNLCPLTCEGSVNQTALTSAVSILNRCIGKNALICNYNMSRTSMAPMSWTTKQILPCSVVNGTLVLNNGTVENLCKTTFTVHQQPNDPSITLVIRATDFISPGFYSCTFDFPSNSIVRALRGLIPEEDLTFLNTPNIKRILRANATSTFSINLKTASIELLEQQQSDFDLVYSNFVNCKGQRALSPDLVELFNRGTNCWVKESVFPACMIDFLANYAAVGLRAAQLNCCV